MNKWLLLGCALMAIGLVSGDLGLTFSISTLSSVKSAIGNSIKAIVTANASVTVNESLDTSGAVTALRHVVADLVVPMGDLLSGIQNATVNKVGPPADLLTGLNELLMAANTGVQAALADAASLESVTRAGWYNSLTGNLTSVSNEMTELANTFQTVEGLVAQVITAQYPYTAKNITTVFTPAVVNTLVTPIKYIVGNLTAVGSIIGSIGKAKQTSVTLQANANKTINANIASLLPVSTAFNKTVNDSQTSVLKLSTTTLTSINSSFAAVLSKSANYNNGDMTNLTTYLANNVVYDTNLQTSLNETVQSTLDNVTTTLNTELSNIINALTLGIMNISTMASTNESKYVDKCESKYAAMYTQSSVSVSRLSACVSQETSSVSTSVKAISAQFAAILAASGSSAVKLSSCTVTNGHCSVSYFASIPSFSAWVSTKYDIVTSTYISDQLILYSRIDNCIMAVSQDIQDLSVTIQDKFVNCLTTGS